LNTGIDAAAALDAVPAGELVDLEQIRVVEDQALRVLVGQRIILRLVGPQDDLRDGL
jgi:hypothetical protein